MFHPAPPSDLLRIRFEEYQGRISRFVPSDSMRSTPVQIEFRFSILRVVVEERSIRPTTDSFYENYTLSSRVSFLQKFSIFTMDSMDDDIYIYIESFRDFIRCPDILWKLFYKRDNGSTPFNPARARSKMGFTRGDEVGNRPVECKAGLHTLSSLSKLQRVE